LEVKLGSKFKARRQTRREKIDNTPDPRFIRSHEYASNDAPAPTATAVPKLEPKNNNQRKAIGLLTDGVPIIFLTGSAGTGKSMLAAYRVAQQLRSKRIKKVFLVRPAVSVGKSVGLLPGDIKEKLAPYFAQTMSHLEKFLGAGYAKYCLEKEVIEMKPVEYLRGMSFEDCIVIAEEVQNFTSEEMEMMLTRLGYNCQIVFTGDTKQHDLNGTSGLETTLKLLDKILQGHPEYMTHDDMDELDDGIGVVRFTPEDVVRSGLTRAFVKLYYHNS
jgi:phosphate starvation-inducible PhoH-like protein